MPDNSLPREYFELIRKAVRERNSGGAGGAGERPLKRHRRGARLPRVEGVPAPTAEPQVVINLEQTPDEVIEVSSGESGSPSESEYDSDDFEDVSDDATAEEPLGNISVTIHKPKEVEEAKSAVRNVCCNDEKKHRRFMHMFQLLCLMSHGALRNSWLNNSKLSRKLNRLVPDKVYELLHPQKDSEMPLRSTRKLLDGLKQTMALWQKHWKVTQRYANGTGLYMQSWDEEKRGEPWKGNFLTKQDFVKQVLKGVGDRDVAAQGFVALLRSCNVNARLVMSPQPCDFTDLKERCRPYDVPYDDMTKYPLFWCEVWDKFAKQCVTVDPVGLKLIEQVRHASKLEPRGAACCRRNMMRYVVAYDRQEGCRDITRRYCQWLNAKVRRRRITKDPQGQQWFARVLHSLHRRKRTKIDDYEDEYFEVRNEDEGMPDNLSDIRNHPYYILERDLRANQVLRAGSRECGYLNLQKKGLQLKVYLRRDVVDLKSGRQWYSEGRVLKTGSRYLKTVQRKGRDGEMEDERLYPREATELYVPHPATYPLGEIKKNTFGNIEVFVPSMIPANCCLIESPLAVRAAKAVGVQYAPAVTRFKFERGAKAKAVVSGVVVAHWFKEAVLAAIEALQDAEDDRERQELEVQALEGWKKLLVKMRIKSDLNSTYGTVREVEENEREQESQAAAGGGGGFFVTGSAVAPDHAPEPQSSDDESQQASQHSGSSSGLEDEYAAFIDDIA